MASSDAQSNTALGPFVRHLFGKHERFIAEAWRKIFVDLDNLTSVIVQWVPAPASILEVGCGEGAMTERLAAAYPQARVTAIDIAPRFGRLYRGRTEGVTFSQETIENLASRQPASFDLVIIADVWHHVAGEFRSSFIAAVREAMAPGAHLVFKEWLPSRAPIHYLAAAADKYISRAPARFLTRDQLNALLSGTFGSGAVQQIASIPPWKNNVAALVCRSSD